MSHYLHNMLPLKAISTPGLSLVFLPITPVGNIKVYLDLPCFHAATTRRDQELPVFPLGYLSLVLSFLLPPLPTLYYFLAVSLLHMNEHDTTKRILFRKLLVQRTKNSKSPVFSRIKSQFCEGPSRPL